MTVEWSLGGLLQVATSWWHRFDAWHDQLLTGLPAWPWAMVLWCIDYTVARTMLALFLILLRWCWRRLLSVPLLLQRIAADTGDPRHLRISVLYAFRTKRFQLDTDTSTQEERMDWVIFFDEHFGFLGWRNASTTFGRWAMGQAAVLIQSLCAGAAKRLGQVTTFFVRPMWKAAVAWLLTALVAAPQGSLSRLIASIATWGRSLPLSVFGTVTSIATVIAIVMTVTRLMDVRGRAEFAKHASFTSRVALATLHEPVARLRSSLTELVNHVAGAGSPRMAQVQKITVQADAELAECRRIMDEHIVRPGLRSEFLRIAPQAARPLTLTLLDGDVTDRLHQIIDEVAAQSLGESARPMEAMPTVAVRTRGLVQFSGRSVVLRTSSPVRDAKAVLRPIIELEVASVEFLRAMDEELNPGLLYRLATSIGK